LKDKIIVPSKISNIATHVD